MITHRFIELLFLFALILGFLTEPQPTDDSRSFAERSGTKPTI